MSLLNPKRLVDLGVVSNLTSEKSISPNAIEMTADRLFEVVGPTWELTETSKQHREVVEVIAVDGIWHLKPNAIYDVMSATYVDIPEGMAALVNIRSTLNRAGVRFVTGVWDAGFRGNLGGILYNSDAQGRLGVGTRVAQVMFFSSDSEGTYAGGYNRPVGEHWSASETGRQSSTTPNQSNTPKGIEQ